MAVPRMSSSKCRCMSPGWRQPDVGAEALDGADAGEGGDERLGHAGLDEVAGLGDVGQVLGPRVERDVEHLRCRTARVCCACHASMAGTRCLVRGET